LTEGQPLASDEKHPFHFEAHLRVNEGEDRWLIMERKAMSAGTGSTLSQGFTLTRKVPRYKLTVPARLTVLRAGVPDEFSGRTLEIGEGGVGVTVATQLLLGESVRVEFLLPHMTTPVRATAVVRYQHAKNFGLQFLRLPADQASVIRYWTRREADVQLAQTSESAQPTGALKAPKRESREPARAAKKPGTELSALEKALAGKPAPEIPSKRYILGGVVATVVIAGALGWWRWESGWVDLESKVPVTMATSATPRLKIPAEEMRRHLRHEVRPDYPEAARQAGVQGLVVLDAVVDESGVVTQTKIVSGAPVLAAAAVDAVRWWRYDPYLVNGQAAVVETTITVNFQLPR
jgi:TonB family protein